MGLRGPQPTPTPILQARGSWRAAEREGEVQFERKAPACPAWLVTEAKAEWRRQVKQLTLAGVIQVVDRAALAVYCEAWAEFALACQQLAKKLEGGDQLDSCAKLVKVKNAAADRVMKLADRFGFAPSARARVKAPASQEKPSGKSRFFANVN